MALCDKRAKLREVVDDPLSATMGLATIFSAVAAQGVDVPAIHSAC